MSIKYAIEEKEQEEMLKKELNTARAEFFSRGEIRPYMKTLAVLARGTKSARDRLSRAFEEFSGLLSGAPYCILNPGKPDEIITWPNVSADLHSGTNPNTGERATAEFISTFPREARGFYIKPTAISMAVAHRPIVEEIIAGLDSTGKRDKKWDKDNPKAGQLFFLRKEKMGIDKFFEKYFKILDTFPSAKVSQLKNSVKQVGGKVEIKIADTPKEVFTAYTAGPQSCMSTLGGGNSVWRDIAMTQDGNWFHPALFYLYSPDTELLIAKRGDEIITRCVLFTETKKHSNIYGDNSYLKNWLATHGYTSLNSSRGSVKPQFKTAFTIKGTLVPEKFKDRLSPRPKVINQDIYICPWPFIDYFSQHASIRFDDAVKEFTITPLETKDKKNKFGVALTFGGTTGYIHSDSCKYASCEFCASKIFGSKGFLSKDGRMYCTLFCAQVSGLALAVQADGNAILVPKEEVLQDAVFGSPAWSTEYAAIRDGAHYILSKPWEKADPKKLTKLVPNDRKRVTGNKKILKIDGDELKPVIIPFKDIEGWVVFSKDDSDVLVLAEADDEGKPKTYAAQQIQNLINKTKLVKEEEPGRLNNIIEIYDDEFPPDFD